MCRGALVLILLLSTVYALGQEQKLAYFDEFSGLSSKRITDIIQDREGYLWIGTLDGLNRYDGVTFESFKSSRDSLSISHDLVSRLTLGPDGSLWIAFYNGAISNYKNGWFKNLSTSESGLLPTQITKMHFDDSGNLWVAQLDQGLFLREPSGRFRHVLNLSDISDTYLETIRKKYNTIFDMIDVDQSTMLLATYNGLYLFNKKTYQLDYIRIKNFSLENRKDLFYRIIKDPHASDTYWLTTYAGGISRFNLNNRSWDTYSFDPIYGPGKNVVSDIAERDENSFWISTENKGLGIFYRDGQFRFIGAAVLCGKICIDKENIIWTSTEKGLLKVTPNLEAFKFIKVPVKSPYTDEYYRITRITYDSINQATFIATLLGDGLHKIQFNKQTTYAFDETGKGNARIDIVDMLLSNGSLYVMASNHLYRYDYANDKLIRLDKGDRYYDFTSITKSSGKLWLTAYRHGLLSYDVKSNRWEHFSTANLNLSTNDLLDAVEDKIGRLWLVHRDGVNIFDGNSVVLKYQIPRSSGISLGAEGDLWVASISKGLLRWKWNGSDYEAADSIAEVTGGIYNVSALNRRSVWYTTLSSLSNLNSEEHTVKHYGVLDGINSVAFPQKVEMMNGKLLAFSSFGGYYEYQDNLKLPDAVPNISLASLKINHKPVAHPNPGESLMLEHSQNNITFDFSVLSYLEPKRNKHYFYLEGYDNEWHIAEKRLGTYTNLSPGHYVLHLKGENSIGIPTKELTVPFEIAPPFWSTWWFYTINISAVITLGVYLYRKQIADLREKQKLKEAELIRQKNAQLLHQNETITTQQKRIENQLAYIENSIRTKNRILAIVGHDLRSPIASIKSIIELLSQGTMTAEEFRAVANDLKQETNAIYKMIENVFEWARIQQNELNIKVKLFSLSKIIDSVVKINLRNALSKEIKIEYESGVQWLANGDEETVHIVLRNILGNAIKFSKRGSTIIINVSEVDHLIKVDVSDQGIGIPAEEILQLMNSGEGLVVRMGTAGEMGSGLGLAICKDLIEKNGGKFYIHSNVNLGTVVSFTLNSTTSVHAAVSESSSEVKD